MENSDKVSGTRVFHFEESIKSIFFLLMELVVPKGRLGSEMFTKCSLVGLQAVMTTVITVTSECNYYTLWCCLSQQIEKPTPFD